MVDATATDLRVGAENRLGENAGRSDGVPKVQGTFALFFDLFAEHMLWGATLRSPHAYACIVRIDPSPAWKIRGVETVLTAEDVPGALISAVVTENGEHGARATCTIACGAGRGTCGRSALALGEDLVVVLHDGVGGKSAVLLGQAHRTAWWRGNGAQLREQRGSWR